MGIKGVFAHELIFGYTHDWNVIAQTCKKYSVTDFYAHISNGTSRRPDSEWTTAITAFHNNGIKFHACIATPAEEFPGTYPVIQDNGQPLTSGGTLWGNCPTNPGYRADLKTNVEAFTTLHAIDGIMFDYIRYETWNMCYCPYCKAAFEAWLGESIPASNWAPNSGDFTPETGSRFTEFLTWRMIPVTEVLSSIRTWALAKRPNLRFSGSVWTLYGMSQNVWKTYLGQDTESWINANYLHDVCPMMYTDVITGPESIEDEMSSCQAYWNVLPKAGATTTLSPLITSGIYGPTTPTKLAAVVQKIYDMGGSGYVIWRYGGAGVDSGGELIDIEPFLAALPSNPVGLTATLNIKSTPITKGTPTGFTGIPFTLAEV